MSDSRQLSEMDGQMVDMNTIDVDPLGHAMEHSDFLFRPNGPTLTPRSVDCLTLTQEWHSLVR